MQQHSKNRDHESQRPYLDKTSNCTQCIIICYSESHLMAGFIDVKFHLHSSCSFRDIENAKNEWWMMGNAQYMLMCKKWLQHSNPTCQTEPQTLHSVKIYYKLFGQIQISDFLTFHSAFIVLCSIQENLLYINVSLITINVTNEGRK